MAGPEYHWYRWQFRVRKDLGGHGDRQVLEPALGRYLGYGAKWNILMLWDSALTCSRSGLLLQDFDPRGASQSPCQ